MRSVMTVVMGVVVGLGLFGGTAEAKRRPPPAATVQWDQRGWQMLGEQQVGGSTDQDSQSRAARVDRDTIRVGRYEGKFSKLTLVVQDSDLELLDFTIHFADRTRYEPKLAHFFKEGQRTRVIDLPPNDGLISTIDLRYRNTPGGGRARLQVWGYKVGEAPRPPVVTPPSWDARGWDLLGEQQVGGRTDRDTITVGRREGRFQKLTLVVSESDLELLDFTIHFTDRTRYEPKVAHTFREGQRTRAIDLPPNGGLISHIDLRYRNTPGGGRAKLAVYGQRVAEAPRPVYTPPQFDQTGWTMLGEQQVGGRIDHISQSRASRVDRDRIVVGKHEGKFSRVKLVVLDSDLELLDFAVKFSRGRDFRPQLRHDFREGQRTKDIDFPGDTRRIKHIDLKYKNTRGGGRAKVQVWGLRTDR